ncbi:MAG: LCP family protein [Alkalispirochaeta sp.]
MKISFRWIPVIAITATVVVFIIVLGGMALRLTRLSTRIENLQDGIGAEVEGQNRLTQQLEANQRQSTRHLQQVRELLNLSPGSYRFLDEDPSQSAGGDGAEAGSDPAGGERSELSAELFFTAVDRIREERQFEQLEAALAETLPRMVNNALPARLEVRSGRRLQWNVREQGETVITLATDGEEWMVSSLNGTQQRIDAGPGASHEDTLTEVADDVCELYAEIQEERASHRTAVAELQRFVKSQEIFALLNGAQLVAATPTETDGATVLPFRTAETRDEAFAVRVRPHPPEITVDGTTADDVTHAREILRERIRESDPRTAAQRVTEASIRRVQEVAQDGAFQTYLDSLNLRLSTELRESIDFFYFDLESGDLESGDGARYGAFAIQKDLGTVYITNAEDVVITRLTRVREEAFTELSAAPPGESSRELPSDFPPGFRPGSAGTDGTSILLVGTHERQADAIILVHLRSDRTISMINIPRDIWWKDRKLGRHAEVYGVPHMVDEIAELTAVDLDGWISVDMYAFIEIVDILGGIEVELEEPLIDPTYRVREAGEWQTLHYEAGTHRLGGVEALRVARSRHTSNDFERALRQQRILTALRDRINRLHAGNLDRVYEIVESLYRHVDTSYSMWELAQFFLGYRNAEIANRTGLTFDNVLYNTWSNLHLRGIAPEDADEWDADENPGQWILLPRDDDWDVIPWFVEQNL